MLLVPADARGCPRMLASSLLLLPCCRCFPGCCCCSSFDGLARCAGCWGPLPAMERGWSPGPCWCPAGVLPLLPWLVLAALPCPGPGQRVDGSMARGSAPRARLHALHPSLSLLSLRSLRSLPALPIFPLSILSSLFHLSRCQHALSRFLGAAPRATRALPKPCFRSILHFPILHFGESVPCTLSGSSA